MQELFFIAVVPPKDIREEVTELKKEIALKYGSKHALNSPPHVTLHMPFKLKESKKGLLLHKLQEVADQESAFSLELKGFDVFEPRVIFIKPDESDELERLHMDVKKVMRSLNILNSEYKNRAFHPHMTIAFRDLKKPVFFEAWRDFKAREFSAVFSVNSFYLLRHDGRVWNLDQEFNFTPR